MFFSKTSHKRSLIFMRYFPKMGAEVSAVFLNKYRDLFIYPFVYLFLKD